MTFFAYRARARNLTSLNWRDVAIPARLAEAVDGRRPPGLGGAGSLLHSGASQETERGGLGLPPDHARLAEELVFRRVYQSLLNRVFGNRGIWPTRSSAGGLSSVRCFSPGPTALSLWTLNFTPASFSTRLSHLS